MKRVELLKQMLADKRIGDIFLSLTNEEYEGRISARQALKVFEFLNEEVPAEQTADPKAEPAAGPKDYNPLVTIPKKRAKRPGSQKIKDLGKLAALVRAGWKVDKIADEFGVSLPTAYKYVKRLRDEGKL